MRKTLRLQTEGCTVKKMKSSKAENEPPCCQVNKLYEQSRHPGWVLLLSSFFNHSCSFFCVHFHPHKRAIENIETLAELLNKGPTFCRGTSTNEDPIVRHVCHVFPYSFVSFLTGSRCDLDLRAMH